MANLSDEKLVERCKYDLSYKFFLGLMPEDNVIESSTLSRFRRQRLADTDILDLLLGKTVSIAKEHKLIDGKTIIVDSTHTLSKCVPLNQVEILQKDSKALRKMIYGVDEKLKESMPQKYEGNNLKKELNYIKELVKFVSAQPRLAVQENISEGASLLKEKVEDIEDHYTLSNDPEARIGHKSADTEFYGYKTHLAMTPERVIVAATLTTGEKGDGPELPELIDKSKEKFPVFRHEALLLLGLPALCVADTVYHGDGQKKDHGKGTVIEHPGNRYGNRDILDGHDQNVCQFKPAMASFLVCVISFLFSHLPPSSSVNTYS